MLLVCAVMIAYPFFVPPTPPKSDHAIVINKAMNRLYYFTDGKLKKSYPVATGRDIESTPEGDFQIVNKTANDEGIGSENVFGTRWMELNAPESEKGSHYGIHGTNAPDSIGHHASAGCIRMSKEDVEELYAEIPLATPVRIIPGTPIHRYLINIFPNLRLP